MMERIFKFFVRTYMRIFHAPQFHGVENVPKEGRIIIAANHPSFFDPVVICLALERWVGFFALKAVIEFPIFGRIARLWGSLPVVPGGDNEPSVQRALNRLRKEYGVGIFPEGRRSPSNFIGPVRKGVGRLAREADAPVIPATIFGAFKVWPKHLGFPMRGRIIVVFHKPLRMKKGESDQEFADRIREVILQSQVEQQRVRAERRQERKSRARGSGREPARP